jgi:uncharacterized protein (DUF362 family)/Pyruvate/2-oxoacid:ferredoxin oxidoreductase delta subunit
VCLLSIASCTTYELGAVRQAVEAVLAPLGTIGRFVRPGMQVLLKPNLLTPAAPDRAITTHPAVVQAVTELVQEVGGIVFIGDSPAGLPKNGPLAWQRSGLAGVAERTGARLVPFDSMVWKRLRDNDYLIARPIFEADLVINLPKLKTHVLTLYTGAVKNIFGTIPGTRKREVHLRAPGVQDFGPVLVDVLELVRPGLTIMDGVLGQEGNGPGMGGTPRPYGLLAASTDPVALDAVLTRAMGYRPGEVLHLVDAGARGIGEANPNAVQITGDRRALDLGPVNRPGSHWYFRAPPWSSAPLRRIARVRPKLSACIGCGRCVEACPRAAITLGQPPQFDLRRCVGCLCCAEICPQGAIEPHRNLIAQIFGLGM